MSQSKIRLFVENEIKPGSLINIRGGQVNYLINVMRRKIADEVVIFNGRDGEWLSEIEYASKKEVNLKVKEKLKEQKAEPDVWLVFAPIKHGRIDYLVEKAVELGASKLFPIITERTIVSRVNLERLKAHIIEAAEQCERLNVPELHNEQKLTKILENWPEDRGIIFCDETGSGKSVKEFFSNISSNKFAIFIGPEGGFTENEFKLLMRSKNVYPIHLGPRVMRADTAALAALSCFQALKGDWDESPKFGKN